MHCLSSRFNFLYGIKDAVQYHNTQEEFRKCLIFAFEAGYNWKRAKRAAKISGEENESGKIKYISRPFQETITVDKYLMRI